MITLRRVSKKTIKFSSPVLSEIKKVVDCLTFKIDGAYFSETFRDGFWDGKKRFYKDNTFSIGLLSDVVSHLEKENTQYRILDYELFLEDIRVTEQDLSTGLRPEQIECVIQFYKHQFGIVIMPTRGGKTFFAAECMRLAIKHGVGSCMFFVDSTDLFNQTVEEFKKFFGITEQEIGMISGEAKTEIKQINIATIQTVSRVLFPSKFKTIEQRGQKKKIKKDKEELKRDMQNKFALKKKLQEIKFLIIDEVQEYFSKKRLGTIKTLNPKMQLAISATPFKSENYIGGLCMKEVVGDVITEIKEDSLIQNGSLVESCVIIILFHHNDEQFDYQTVIEKKIILNEERNVLIQKLSEIFLKNGLKTLFFFSRKEHGRILSKKTGITFVSGDDDTESREYIKNEFLSKDGGVLFASNIYNKGISLNNCQVLVNTSSGLEKSSIIQKRGRVLAKVGDKDMALIVDIFDDTDYLRSHSMNRLEAYESKTKPENIFILEFDNDFYTKFEDIVDTVFKLK